MGGGEANASPEQIAIWEAEPLTPAESFGDKASAVKNFFGQGTQHWLKGQYSYGFLCMPTLWPWKSGGHAVRASLTLQHRKSQCKWTNFSCQLPYLLCLNSEWHGHWTAHITFCWVWTWYTVWNRNSHLSALILWWHKWPSTLLCPYSPTPRARCIMCFDWYASQCISYLNQKYACRRHQLRSICRSIN